MEGSIIGVSSYEMQEVVDTLISLNKRISRICGMSESEIELAFKDVDPVKESTGQKAKKQRRTHNGKKVIDLGTEKVFKSVRAAGRSIGVMGTEISSVCRGKRAEVRGHRFAYYTDYLNGNLPRVDYKWKESAERGRKLNALRENYGFSCKEISEYMNVSSQTVNAYMTRPTEETYIMISNIMREMQDKLNLDWQFKCKKYMGIHRVYQYEIAMILGISESTLSIRLNNEADAALYDDIVNAVNEIVSKRKHEEEED